MRVTILGSGTLLPDDDHRSAAHLVEDGGRSLLLDCGPGTLHGLARHEVDWVAIDRLAISHFHTDHVGDVPGFLWALKHAPPPGREKPLTILGPPGLRSFLERLDRAFGSHVLAPHFPLDVVELERAGEWIAPEGSGRLRSHPVPHTEESVAWRWDGSEGSVGYTGDTGPEPDLEEFFRGVDVLICECSVLGGDGSETHLTPDTAAALARGAAPEVTVLTHLYPEVDRGRLPDLLRSSGYTGRSVVGVDGLQVEGRPGALDVHSPQR